MKDFITKLKDNYICRSAFFLVIATILSFTFYQIIPNDPKNVVLIYILALVMISRYTNGYRYGIIASIISVICVNFFFTYPHFRLNFTITGYPLTFLIMLAITISTSTLTIHMKHQSEILAQHEIKFLEADKEKMRANLLRAVSHDLRTPLTSIIGSVSSLMEPEQNLSDEEQLEIEKHIYDDANWLLNMVENLLTVTRIQNDTSKVKKTPELLEEVISEAVTRFKKRYTDAKVVISVPDEFIMIPMDAMLIEQVIMNLLENAKIHSGSTEPIKLHVTADSQQCIFQVIDYGIGISAERLETIFDGLPNNDSGLADSQKGMGIGLSICKTIIAAHNGTIQAGNHEHGAIFSFTLPRI